jgi:hypothetical protein
VAYRLEDLAAVAGFLAGVDFALVVVGFLAVVVFFGAAFVVVVFRSAMRYLTSWVVVTP